MLIFIIFNNINGDLKIVAPMNVMVVHSYRAEASVPRLAELNPYVTVKACTESLDEGSKLDFLQDFQAC